MNNHTDDLSDLFSDVLPAKRKRRRAPRARFEIRVEWGGGSSMEGEGPLREMLAEFATYTTGRDGVLAVFVYRNGHVLREWRSQTGGTSDD